MDCVIRLVSPEDAGFALAICLEMTRIRTGNDLNSPEDSIYQLED